MDARTALHYVIASSMPKGESPPPLVLARAKLLRHVQWLMFVGIAMISLVDTRGGWSEPCHKPSQSLPQPHDFSIVGKEPGTGSHRIPPLQHQSLTGPSGDREGKGKAKGTRAVRVERNIASLQRVDATMRCVHAWESPGTVPLQASLCTLLDDRNRSLSVLQGLKQAQNHGRIGSTSSTD